MHAATIYDAGGDDKLVCFFTGLIVPKHDTLTNLIKIVMYLNNKSFSFRTIEYYIVPSFKAN